jgi:hypothetical protein
MGGPDTKARALHVIATLEGGMVLARVFGSIEAFDQAAATLAEPLAISKHDDAPEAQTALGELCL